MAAPTFSSGVTEREEPFTPKHVESVDPRVDPSAGQITFGEWWPVYLARAGKRESTRARDEGAARKWLLPHLGDVPLVAITPAMVDRIKNEMETAGLAPSTVRTFLGVLQGAMSAAVDDCRLARSPCRAIKRSSERRGNPQFLTIDELHHLASVIDPRYRAMVYLAGVVGLRIGECAALRVDRINFFKRTVTVAETATEIGGRVIFGEPRTEASIRTVTMPRFVAKELAAHLIDRTPFEPSTLVFVGPGGGVLRRKHFRSRVWKPTVEAAGFDDLTFHGLRHSAAGIMIELGAHPRIIQRRLGHSSLRTTLDAYGSVLDYADGDVDAVDDVLTWPDISRLAGFTRIHHEYPTGARRPRPRSRQVDAEPAGL